MKIESIMIKTFPIFFENQYNFCCMELYEKFESIIDLFCSLSVNYLGISGCADLPAEFSMLAASSSYIEMLSDEGLLYVSRPSLFLKSH